MYNSGDELGSCGGFMSQLAARKRIIEGHRLLKKKVVYISLQFIALIEPYFSKIVWQKSRFS